MTRIPTWRRLDAGVIGGGRSGVAAAALLSRLHSKVLLSESGSVAPQGLPASVEVETGGHTAKLLNCDLLIRSPGVSGHLPILSRARQNGIPIWSELELGARVLSTRHIMAITGTNGKTTTTTLLGEIFKSGWNQKVFVGGNIGTPLSDFARRAKASSAVVLEVSSYQLEDIQEFHPQVSAILNITPDHLEHHGTMAAYAAAKARIFMNQNSRDVCVLNADDPWCRRLASKVRARVFYFSRRRRLTDGIWMNGSHMVLKWGTKRDAWPLDWELPGDHNVENGLAAAAMAIAAGIPTAKIRAAFQKFRGVEHRLEQVRTLDGVRYVNDSKATNVDSTRVALESFREPLVVIMGGRGKGAPYTSLRGLVKSHVRRLLLIGEDAAGIRRDLESAAPCDDCRTMESAVRKAQQLARPGEIVLLSPACASFDQYGNYEERGRHFKRLVAALRGTRRG